MGRRCPVKSDRHEANATIFPHQSCTTGRLPNSIRTIVNNDKINILSGIKRLSNLVKQSVKCIVEIVTIGVLTIHAMDQWIALCIGFKAKGLTTIAVCLHLISIEGLNLANCHFH